MRASFNLGKTSSFYSIGSAAILMLSSYGEYAVFISTDSLAYFSAFVKLFRLKKFKLML